MHGMVRYLLRTLFPVQRARLPLLLGLLVVSALALMSAGGYAGPEETSTRPLTAAEMARLQSRVHMVSALYTGATAYVDTSVQPLQTVLLQQRNDPLLTRRVAVSLVRHSNRLQLNPRLLLGMLLVENPNVNPRARSRVGAQGLMQVMPLHRGRWACGADLNDVDTNICYGAHVFEDNLKDTHGDVERALLLYNGCVRGTNTPDCRQYPQWVFARAARARQEGQAKPPRPN